LAFAEKNEEKVWENITGRRSSIRNLRMRHAVVTVTNLTWNYNHTYLLTPWSLVLLEKLTGLQQVKKFPAF
jgi:hypothetical protein